MAKGGYKLEKNDAAYTAVSATRREAEEGNSMVNGSDAPSLNALLLIYSHRPSVLSMFRFVLSQLFLALTMKSIYILGRRMEVHILQSIFIRRVLWACGTN
jgi:hypothetical protein